MNPEPKKPRCDSMLDRLPENRVMELRDGLLGGWSHEECMSWLATECALIIRSGSTLTRFYKRHCEPVVSERRKLAAVKSEIYVKQSGRTDWDAATMELVSQVTFEMLDGQRTDPKVAEKFVKLVLKRDAQDQSRSKARELAKAKADAGIDALADDAKGNPEAEAALKAYVQAMKKKQS